MRNRIGRSGRRGSALVAVLLVILILTVVGLGVAYFSQMEDSLSGAARMTRAAFYAAETGLRKGEMVIRAVQAGSVAMSSLLTCGACVTPPLTPPGGGGSAVILKFTDPEDSVDKEFVNLAIPLAGAVVDRGTYSLYVRNNPEDPGGATNDSDNIILLISVGQVQGAGRRVYTKILEEQLMVGAPGAPVGSQYLSNAGGTSSGASGN